MASIIPGYNYDIFISYRQKDNKGDRWVSEFVEALKTELESTFKDEISVYFDINPDDGLLETHDVDESLKEKLKCLIFIPIISRTYCDPKSFAWEHEFKAFVEQASQDRFGLKVKLPGGNIASRVLPVHIHDLDNADIRLCESILGGFLRGVEFIYKSPGVNRPLRSKEEKPHDNLNQTIYRDQINKVALAIKEVVIGLMTEPTEGQEEKIQQRKTLEEIISIEKKSEQEKLSGLTSKKILFIAVTAAIIVITAIIAYPKIFNNDSLRRLRSSGQRLAVAIMPFQNMTNDSLWNIWQDGVQDYLITSLSTSEELQIRQPESIKSILRGNGITNYASITPSFTSIVAKKLDASVFINGTITQAGPKIRINTRITNSKTGEIIKSFTIDGTYETIMQVIDSLSADVRDFLVISKLSEGLNKEKGMAIEFVSSNSPEAYRNYMLGTKSFFNMDFPTSIMYLRDALNIDSNFVAASVLLSCAYLNTGSIVQARNCCLRARTQRDQLPQIQKIYLDWIYSWCFETPYEASIYVKQLLEFDDQWAGCYYLLGAGYVNLMQYNYAIPPLEKALDLYDSWGIKPLWFPNYEELGIAYHLTGQYRKEKQLYKKAETDFPDEPGIIGLQAILAFSEGDTSGENLYIKKYIQIQRDRLNPEADIMYALGSLYTYGGAPEKALEYYRRALSLDPQNPVRMNNLAFCLINNDINVNEGMELAEKALKISPDHFGSLHCKGLGLYKMGNYKEALELMQKGWDLRMQKSVYNHGLYIQLEEVKKAVAGQL